MLGCPAQQSQKLLPSRTKYDKREDERLRLLVHQYGTDDWSRIALFMCERTARQCRERWRNFLHPGLVNGPWTPEEDRLLIELYHQHGPNWGIMHRIHFPTRSNNNIKNHWAILAPQLLKMTTKLKVDIEAPTSNQDTPQFPMPIIRVHDQQDVRKVAEKYSIQAILV
jgi:hypothetical protein